ncbi:MAG: hypothetical protein NTZ39_03790 [Methanoregula sp.]|nr:hypothetical protein [Methanoregula sp.]
MKTDKEWFREKMTDAVADVLWERMIHQPSSKSTGDGSHYVPEPDRDLRDF